MRILPFALALVLVPLLQAPMTEAGASGAAVDVLNFQFRDSETASTTTLAAIGEPVTWTWRSGSVPHTVSSRLALPAPTSFESGVRAQGDAEFTLTFDVPGVYTYFCRIHPSMTGTVVVAG